MVISKVENFSFYPPFKTNHSKFPTNFTAQETLFLTKSNATALIIDLKMSIQSKLMTIDPKTKKQISSKTNKPPKMHIKLYSTVKKHPLLKIYHFLIVLRR